jgi:hypothetical protein
MELTAGEDWLVAPPRVMMIQPERLDASLFPIPWD